MTLQKIYDSQEPAKCPQCGLAMVLRPKHRYPVITQALFGISFVLFLFFFDKIRNLQPYETRQIVIWGWAGVQIILGIILVQRRMMTRKTIYRCIRCSQDLR